MTTAAERHEKLRQAVRDFLEHYSKRVPASLRSVDESIAWTDRLTELLGRLARLSQWNG